MKRVEDIDDVKRVEDMHDVESVEDLHHIEREDARCGEGGGHKQSGEGRGHSSVKGRTYLGQGRDKVERVEDIPRSREPRCVSSISTNSHSLLSPVKPMS